MELNRYRNRILQRTDTRRVWCCI